MSSESLEHSTLLAAVLNSAVAIFLRVFTSLMNAFILRRVSSEILGLINVRLLLLVDTILFISREAFRKSCLKTPSNGDWRGTFNLVWLSLPLGILSSFFFGFIWIRHLELPEDADICQQYINCVFLMALSAIAELSMEPFFVSGQIFMWVKFRSAIDILVLIIRSSLLTLAVIFAPQQVVFYFGLAYLASVLFQWLAYFTKLHRCLQKGEMKPLTSIKDVFPTFKHTHFDEERFGVAKSFLKQGILKQLLTEGEKYLFTYFSLMTLAQQGIYDAVANLGSLVARLVFSKVEESAYLYFNMSVIRGKAVDVKVARNLGLILRAMTLFGLIVLTFGYSYSHLLLHIYGGKNLSQGLGPILLRGHCVFVLLMAVNGVSECYSFAVMTSQEVDKYNYKMTCMAALFLLFSWILSSIYGPLGFIMANWCNFAMRILHNCFVIHKRHAGTNYQPLEALLPPLSTLLCLVVSAIICQMSEVFIYDCDNFTSVIQHLIVGGICFLLTLTVLLWNERQIVAHAVQFFKKKKSA